MTKFVFASVAAALIVTATAAQADKKNGTLNIALSEPMSGVDMFHNPTAESQVHTRAVFDTMLSFHPQTGKLLPSLATSWKQIDPKTWEFKLRKDVKFHDGSKFNADVVVYTINWVSDPKVKIRVKGRFTWMKGAEKVDDYTVRVISKRPSAVAIARLAVITRIIPSDVHGSLAKKPDFVRNPVGTGPYKAIQSGKRGIVLVPNPDYRHGNAANPAGKIKKVSFRTIPDEQTQVAEMLAGNVDLTRMFNKAVVENLTAKPNFTRTIINGLAYFYVALDAANRTGIKALSDVRVRRAIAHAIDRDTIRKSIMIGGEFAKTLTANCAPVQFGCAATVDVPKYDPAKAKALLKEAGYANGFDLELVAISRTRDVAVVISEYLRKVGVRVKIQNTNIVGYRKMQRQNKLQAYVMYYGSGGIPDATCRCGRSTRATVGTSRVTSE